MTAAHIAGKYGNEEILKKLIEKNIDAFKPAGVYNLMYFCLYVCKFLSCYNVGRFI